MDQFYFEQGYLEAGYFVYTADAAIDLTTAATQTATAVKTVDVSIDTDSLFTPTLVANAVKNMIAILQSSSTMTTTAVFLADGNSQLASAVAQTVQADITASADCDFASQFASSIQIDKFAGVSASITSDNALTALGGKLIELNDIYPLTWDQTDTWDEFLTNDPGWQYLGVLLRGSFSCSGAATILTGETKAFEAYLTTAATISVTASKITETSSQLSSSFTQSASGQRDRDIDLVAFTDAALSAQAQLFKDYNIAATATFSIGCDFVRFRATESDEDGEFNISLVYIRSRASAFETQAAFSFVASIDGTLEAQSDLASEFAQTASIDGTLEAASDLTATATLSCTISHIEGADLEAFTDAALTAAGDRTRSTEAALVSESSVSAEFDVFNLIDPITAASQLSVSTTYLLGNLKAALTAAFAARGNSRISTRPTVLTSESGDIYDTAVIDNSTYKFGGGSLAWNMATDINGGQMLWDGTNFKIFADSYTWTSSDGLSWTRADSDKGTTSGTIRYGNGYYVSLASGGLRYSTNGTTWTTVSLTLNEPSAGAIGLGYIGSTWVVVGISIRNSTIRIGSWKNSNITVDSWGNTTEWLNTATINGLARTDLFVTSGSIGLATRTSTSTTWSILKYNGTSVSNINIASTRPSTSHDLGNAIAHNGSSGYIIEWQKSLTPSTITTTTNGSTFTNVNMPGGVLVSSADFVNSNYVMLTNAGLYAGTDPASLTLVDTEAGLPRYGSSKYVSFGNRSQIRYSSDLTTWTQDTVDETSGNSARLIYTRGDGSDLANVKTIDFWAMNGYSFKIYESSHRQFSFDYNTSTGFSIIRDYNLLNAFSSGRVNSVSGGPSSGAWFHVRIAINGSNASVYFNGERKLNYTDFNALPTNAHIEIESVSGHRLDEFLVSDSLLTDPNTTTFTVPTGQWANDSNTDLLLHFNSDFSDDSRPAVVERATLTSQAVISALGGIVIGADSAVNAEFTVSADIQKNVQEADSGLNSEFAVSAVGNSIFDFSSDFNSETTVAADIDRSRDVDSQLASEATVNAINERTRDTGSTLTAAAALTITISHIEGADITVFTDVAVSATAEKITDVESENESSLSVNIDALRVRYADSEQNTDFALGAENTAIFSGISQISSEFSTGITENRLRDFDTALDGILSLTSTADRFAEFDSDLAAEFTVNIDTVKTVEAEVNVQAFAATLTAAAKIGDFLVTLESQATLSAAPIFTADAASTLTSIATAEIIAVKSVETTSALSSNTEVTAQLDGTLEAAADFSAAFTQPDTQAQAATDVVWDQNSEFTQTTSAERFRDTTIVLASSATFTAAVQRNQFASSSLSSESTVNTQAVKTASGEITAISTADLTITISHIEGADLVAFTNSQLNVIAFVGIVGSSHINSEFSQTAVNDRIRDDSSSLSAQFTETSTVNEIVQLASALSSDSAVDAQAVKTAAAVAVMSSEAALTITISHIEGADLVAFTNASVSADIERIRPGASAVTASSALSITATRIKSLASTQQSSVSVSATGSRILGTASASVSSQSQLTVVAGFIADGAVTITSAMAFAAQVREIDLDSINQFVYKIPREVWSWTIQEETRLHTIRRY